MSKVIIDTWYVCNYIDRQELCKVTRHKIEVDEKTVVFCYKVVCYYTGKDIYISTLADCKRWIEQHISSRGYLDK